MDDRHASASRWPTVFGWAAALLLLATLVLIAFTGPAYRAGLIEIRFAIFTLMRLIFFGAVACVVVGAVAAAWNWRRDARGWAVTGAVALVAGLALALHLLSWMNTARSVPPIHDISTDLENPPEFVDVAPLRADAPNPVEHPGREVAEQQSEAYPDLVPIRVAAPRDEVFAAAVAVVEDMGWALVAQAPGEGRIEATDTTFYFGFRDDVVIRLRRERELTVIDVRSKSRVGMSDVGTNATRIRSFRDALLRRLDAEPIEAPPRP